MKISDFLKGGTMILQFNPAQLSRPQQQSLIEVLGVIESENDQEIDVRVVEFPIKFMVKLDDDIEMLLDWNAEKQSYAGLATPEPTEESQQELAGLEKAQENFAGQESLPGPEPELDLSPVIERSQALARVLANLTKPLENDHRFIVWTDFLITLLKELEK